MTAIARRSITRPAVAPRHTSCILRTTSLTSGALAGYEWAVTDRLTGLVVRSGWVAGSKREAQAEINLAIWELRS